MTCQHAFVLRFSLPLLFIALLAGCANSLPTASPMPTPSPSEASGATLSASGKGAIECMTPHGCLASFIVESDSWVPAPDYEPSLDTPHFDVTWDGGWTLSGPVIGAPETLAPGRYRLALAVSEVSDLPSIGPDGRTGLSLMWSEVRCTRDIAVEAETRRVIVVAHFTDPCRIDVVLDPPG
jgi:hypothetical protein